jgi:hypothetical protein
VSDEQTVDELGPVDWIVVEFPGSKFKGEIIPELVSLEERGIIRILDLVLLKKEEDGTYDALEMEDVDESELGGVRSDERALAMLLSADDVERVAEAMEPGSTAGILVWENLWAAPFASACRRAGGQLIAGGRIPTQALLAAVEADLAEKGA